MAMFGWKYGWTALLAAMAMRGSQAAKPCTLMYGKVVISHENQS